MAIIWVLTGSKSGDNAQVLRAASAMGLNYEIRRIVMRPGYETAKPYVRPSLHHIDLKASDSLEAPWPDIVITIGRRLSMVALWIKRKSGGACRIALFNAPKGRFRQFDLLIAPAYYKFKHAPNVCWTSLPLLTVDPEKIETARTKFASTIGQMPRPLTVLLLGGGTGMLQFDAETAQKIVEKVRDSQGPSGSLYVSTSRRTSPEIAEVIAPLLGPSDAIFRWSADLTDNPYFGLLAYGDNFVVTGDSISMIIEVAKQGRPLAIADLPRVNMRVLNALRSLGWKNPKGRLARPLIELGTRRQTRDFDRLYDYLIEMGIARRLGERASGRPKMLPDDLAHVAERLRQLARLGY